MPSDPNQRAGAHDIDVKIAGTAVPKDEVVRLVVDLDLNQPDMAVITLNNMGSRHSTTHNQGDPVEVNVGDSNTNIFKGEIVGIEPTFEASGDSKVIIRAFNKLHRLLRGRKSKTYQNQSDGDIVSAVASAAGLSPDLGQTPPSIQHKHIYQHNQTDLEFLRTRAARLGYAVWVEDTKLCFKKPDTSQDSGIEFHSMKRPDSGHLLKRLSLRMSSAGVVKKVTVRGWDPEQKKEIVGEVTAASSRLGSTNAAAAANSFGEVKTFTVDHPIASVEEAKAIAQAKLDDAMMSYITGELECIGKPEYKPGIVIKIVCNEDQADDKFNGKYFLTGVAHMYSHSGGGGAGGGSGGYTAVLKLARDAEKGS